MFVLLGIIVLVGVAYAGIFNGLVSARQKVREAWSGIDVQLKRRYDLIPNLVDTVKGYAKHEQETLEKIVAARAAAIAVPEGAIAKQSQAENVLSGTLKSLFSISENYPNLKANENFLNLQNQLAETEDQIASARRIYNGNATALNVKVEGFPSNIIAELHHFERAEFFEIDESERAAVEKAPQSHF